MIEPLASSLSAQQLDEALATRIIILDGAMGTMLQARRPTAADYGGARYEGCLEQLCRTRSDWVREVHRAYLEAGADIITTNSFQGSSIVLDEFGLASDARELNLAAAKLARQAADEYSTPSRPRFVAGALGPTNRSLSLRGDISFERLRDSYYDQGKALLDGGADLLLFETVFDTRNLKAGLLAIQKVEREIGARVPVMLSATIERRGTMLAGQAIDAFCASVAHVRPLSIGLNCATGPDLMADHLRTLAHITPAYVSCHPNAGLPDEAGRYPETPHSFAAHFDRFLDHGWLNIIGGCCGTTPEHIRVLAQMAEGRRSRAAGAPARRACYAGVELVEAEESTRPLIVGERTNATGSRRFRRMLAEEKWDEATEIARRQAVHGAQIIDVCLQSSDRDETNDIDPFYARLMPKIRAPIMIETTDPVALERALTWCPGKSLINSISLEDGESQFARVCPLAQAYGAAIVVATIDEDPDQAQALTRDRKVAIAERSVHLLTGKYGISPEDIVIDPLVFPCASGDEQYIGSALESIEALRLIKQRIPLVKTLLGVSAVSFGLPDAARPVVNAVFLYHATKAGLDLAIVNAEKLERYASIPADQRQLAENLLFDTARVASHVTAIADRFRAVRMSTRKEVEASLDERLARCIVEGTTHGLIADLERKRREGASPLEIINGPLMSGMAEVGRLFNDNELIVAEVLQSAEVMNAAVSHLRPFMETSEAASRGTILLATVKGDVHDIGKNLVDIVLTNNGYRVVDLGIRVAPDVLIRACREHHPDAIGLSGLLVKSAHQMTATAADLRESGVDVPLVVGGAALTEAFTRTRIAPAYGGRTFYARDAMSGLNILNALTSLDTNEAVELQAAALDVDPPGAPEHEVRQIVSRARSSRVRTGIRMPLVRRFERCVEEIADANTVWRYINPFMLYNRHLGFKGQFQASLAGGDQKALELSQLVEQAKEEAARFMRVRLVWQFFEVEREGNAICVFGPAGTQPIVTFPFERQAKADGLCLSDYVLDPAEGRRDQIGFFVVTAGEGIRERAEVAKKRGEYRLSHTLLALALETAEGGAEWVHQEMRDAWGFPDPPEMTMADRFISRYRGKRYSFGYPACPDLALQRDLWELLKPEEIGVHLTEGFMMDPEASVSAMVFHHPDAEYFAVLAPALTAPTVPSLS